MAQGVHQSRCRNPGAANDRHAAQDGGAGNHAGRYVASGVRLDRAEVHEAVHGSNMRVLGRAFNAIHLARAAILLMAR